jgi:uncharacterized RDD family membrane protein YckC
MRFYLKGENVVNNTDDLEIDNLLENNLFKPLTNGLGFHHSIKEKKEVALSLREKSLDLKSDFEKRAQTIAATQILTSETKIPNSMGELSAFYQKAEEIEQKLDINIESEESYSLEASIVSRFMAWGLDIIIVASLIALVLITSVLTAGIPFSFFSDNAYNLDITFFSLLFTSLFYLFYFSFFDKTNFSTPGKRILGLKVQRLSGKEISYIQSINRSFISLMSISTLGLMSFLKLQDKLTDTIVISK